MNLTELTQYVWDQTDTTEYDLPATTIAAYIDEAFQRTIAAENMWPTYEKTWTVIVPVGGVSATLDADVNRPTACATAGRSRTHPDRFGAVGFHLHLPCPF